MRTRYFYGWNVVGATFVMALWSFGLGFYGIAVYVAMLQQLHGWSASAVSAPVTVYYVAGALLTAAIASVYERFGSRIVVATGAVAMAAGLATLGVVTRPWQLYPAFLVMSVGWGSMSGAAINIILAPSFERRRGLAVSIAFNGATLGGVVVAPALIPIIGAVGFTRALACAAVVLLAVLGAGRERDDGGGPDRASGHRPRRRSAGPTPRLERDPRHPGRGIGIARVGAVGGCRLCRLRALRPGRGQPDDASRPHPRRRVAAG